MTKTTDPFRFDLIPPGSAVLCALSGGADSMYLLCRLLEGAERGDYTVRAAHYHHGLRQRADEDESFVRLWCEKLGVPLTAGRGDVPARARAQGTGIEETARAMRYDFLRSAARETGCGLIATGHQAEDNAETVLMDLIRGCGTLRGIPEARGGLIRPMLAVRRTEILRWLDEHHIPHREDESNADERYTRNRVRLSLLPLLEGLNPQAVGHINAAARSCGEDDALLLAQAEALLMGNQDEHGGVPAAVLAAAPRPIALRALRLLAGGERRHLEALLTLCADGKSAWSLDVPGGRVTCSFGRVYPPVPPPPQSAALAMGAQRWGRWHIRCERAVCPPKAYVSPGEFYLAPGGYTVRPRQEGDRLRLGPRPEKTIKKLMIEQKLPAPLRDGVPVLACGNAAAAAGGLGPHRDALAAPGAESFHITITKEKEENRHAPGY